jgi:hypothetical protein
MMLYACVMAVYVRKANIPLDQFVELRNKPDVS